MLPLGYPYLTRNYMHCERLRRYRKWCARDDERGAGVIELLAPAGTPDALLAAVAAGADAVYVGLGAFNARAANGGFSLEELERGCTLAHAHGARVYVTLNSCLYDDELSGALELATEALSAGADALIVADLGMCRLLREQLPAAELHLSTQSGAQCASAVRFAVQELRVDRVTCARELSVKELAGLCATGVPIEAFCHGAICVCYSGACAYSALMRDRSANRGDCTQPCRLSYELRDGEGHILAGGAWDRALPSDAARQAGDRLLCPRDYLGIRHIPELVQAGIASLKIEGRMKAPDYVFNVVRCYRRALDAALAGTVLNSYEIDALEAQLARSFSRGFTDGYLVGRHRATGAELMSVERAINQGLAVGVVEELAFDGAQVRLTREVSKGDMLEIRSTPGPDVPADVPKRWPIVSCPCDAGAGERVFVRCKRKIALGSDVHVVRSLGVLEDARAAIEGLRAQEERAASDGREADSGAGAQIESEPLGRRPAHARRKGGDGSPFARSESSPAANASVIANQVSLIAGAHRLEGNRQRSPWECEGLIDLGEVCRQQDLVSVRAACQAVAQGEAAAVLCRNIGQIEEVRAAGVPWEAATPLNVWNALSAHALWRWGARRIWLPEELGEDRASRVRAAASSSGVSVPLDLTPRGSTPLMVMEHCVLTAEGPCSHDCERCRRRMASMRGERILVELDRNSAGAYILVRVDERGRTRLYR